MLATCSGGVPPPFPLMVVPRPLRSSPVVACRSISSTLKELTLERLKERECERGETLRDL